MFPIFAGSNPSGYNLTRSLRIRRSATAYLSRTPSTTGTGGSKTWTYSLWVKRGVLGVRQVILDGYAASAGHELEFGSNDILEFASWGGAAVLDLATTQVFRDPSAYYHIVLAVDTTQATAANRMKLYVNGSQVTAFGVATYPALNALTYIGSNVLQEIGRRGDAQFYFDGYTTEVNFVDGQQLTPSSFGSTNALTGVWQPAPYTGSYGTNGFILDFEDNSALTTSSNVGLGKDTSGNANYWVTNNISITAGVTYDSMTDVPTLTSATAANFAVLNPLDVSATQLTLSNGNLTATQPSTGTSRAASSTFRVSTGKWYFEGTTTVTSGTSGSIGIADNANATATYGGYRRSGGTFGLTGNPTFATYTNGDVIGVAFDADAKTVSFYKNGTLQGTGGYTYTGSDPVGSRATVDSGDSTGAWQLNFGQRPFSYTAPTGFVALNTYNLPTSTIVKGNTVMDATLYTGTLLSNAVTNAASFKPDLVWVKSRSAATSHKLTDSVRGVTKGLVSNTTAAETTDTQGLTAFGSAGFTVGTDTNYNNLAATYVGWQWQAGQGSTSSNTNGTITSTVSVNASAGFSVVTYTGTGVAATVGHGLGVAPAFIINKSRSAVISWAVYHSALTGTAGIFLDQTSLAVTNSGYWNNTNPTSSVFSIGTSTLVNVSSQTQVAYCWAEIAGFSKFGIYTGNGSTDGVFVFTPFRPKFVIIKRTDATGDWYTFDTSRDPYNATAQGLSPNSSAAEASYTGWGDLLSNGFKIRRTDAAWNASGGTYIYMAFAENPLKNSLAR